jgi:predicted N-acyltransferase
VLFPIEQQADLLEQAGMAKRVGIQYHWQNAGYQTFEDFLSRYSSKRRNQLRRERRELTAQGIELQVITGTDLRPLCESPRRRWPAAQRIVRSSGDS